MVLVSTIFLFVGYFATSTLQKKSRFLLVFHGFLKVLIVGLIFLEMIPFCALSLGWLTTISFFVLGWISITILEQFMFSQKNLTTIILATLALSVHALLDGVLLAESDHIEDIILAVILHRIPMGMLIGCFFIQRPLALTALSCVALGTVLGYSTTQFLPVQPLIGVQAVAAGSLFHIIHAHSPDISANLPIATWLRYGMLIGGVFLVLLLLSHSHEHNTMPTIWLCASIVALVSLFIFPKLKHNHIVELTSD